MTAMEQLRVKTLKIAVSEIDEKQDKISNRCPSISQAINRSDFDSSEPIFTSQFVKSQSSYGTNGEVKWSVTR